jgi:hypothetical protein
MKTTESKRKNAKVITFHKDSKGNYPLYTDAKKLIKSKMKGIK